MMDKLDCSLCILKSDAAKNLHPEELNIMNESCVVVNFDKDETIFKEDALSSNIIYLQKGMVKLITKGPVKNQILKIKKAPCYLGLPTTMGDKINHYSAVAIVPTKACFIDISVFKKILSINDEFSYQIIVELCKNELQQFDRCVNLLQKQVFGRLAENLIYFSDELFNSDEFELPLNRNEFSDLVCTSRESISRMLKELSDESIISLDGKNIKILDKSKLLKIKKSG